MSHFSTVTRPCVRPWAVALSTALVLSLAGCGGDDDIQAVAPPAPPPPLTGAGPQNVPSTATIVAAQANIDGTAGPALAASGVPTDAQIVVQQAALDGATTSGPSINANQAAMDANGEKPYQLPM